MTINSATTAINLLAGAVRLLELCRPHDRDLDQEIGKLLEATERHGRVVAVVSEEPDNQHYQTRCLSCSWWNVDDHIYSLSIEAACARSHAVFTGHVVVIEYVTERGNQNVH